MKQSTHCMILNIKTQDSETTFNSKTQNLALCFTCCFFF